MGFEQIEVGWTQLRTLNLTADSPATQINIPGISSFRKYVLVIPAAADVQLVTAAGQTVSTMLTSGNTKIFGVFESSVVLYAYAAAPTAITITPFGDENGELDELPVGFPEPAGFVTWTYYENAEACFEVDHDANFGVYRVQNVAGTGAFNFTFHVPFDFDSLQSINIGYFADAGASGAGKDIDLESMYCGVGEQYNVNNVVDTTSTYTIAPAGELGMLEITHMYPNLEASDCCGINVDHNAIGGTIHYLGIILRYLRAIP